MRRRQANRPFARATLVVAGALRVGTGSAPPATIDVSPGVGRVVQNLVDPCAVGFAPQHLVRHRAVQGTNRQRQVVGPQIAHHPARAPQLGEFGED